MMRKKPAFEMISPAAAHKEMLSGPVLVWDVREADEFAAGHIPGAESVPLCTVETTAEDTLPDKSVRILIYCQSGRRSHMAAELLAAEGYTNVADFGGIADWPYEVIQ